MQRFHVNVNESHQGDRVALCIGGLDSKGLERGVVCSPHLFTPTNNFIIDFNRIKYYPGELNSGMKIHITSGHDTQLCSITFFRGKDDNLLFDNDYEYINIIPNILFIKFF